MYIDWTTAFQKKKIKAEIDRTKWGKRFQTFIDGSLKSSLSKNQEGEKFEYYLST